MKTYECTFMIYLAELFLEWGMYQTNVYRKSKHTFYVP